MRELGVLQLRLIEFCAGYLKGMPKDLRDSVVVITGASSGIGRATAFRFAAKGAKTVLVARRELVLRQLADEIVTQEDTEALPLAADVRDFPAVEGVAARAIAEYGRIDIWVNNAGVALFAPFHKAPLDIYRAVVETNYFGVVHGMRAVLPYMLNQDGGVIVNTASILGEFGVPTMGAYVSSKWAIRGLCESLRQELRGTGVKVATLLPGSIDTPIYQNAANYTGRVAKPPDPITSADRAAAAVVDLARRPRREATVGTGAGIVTLQHRLLPGLTELIVGVLAKRNQFLDTEVEPTSGSVIESTPEYTGVSGGWKHSRGFGARAAVKGVKAALNLVGSAAAKLTRIKHS